MGKISSKRRQMVIRLRHKRYEKMLKLKARYEQATTLEERALIREKIRRLRPELPVELESPPPPQHHGTAPHDGR